MVRSGQVLPHLAGPPLGLIERVGKVKGNLVGCWSRLQVVGALSCQGIQETKP